MKKVLFLIPDLAHGGAERVLVNLVNNIDSERFDVTVQTLFDEGVNKQYLRSDIKYKSFLKHGFRGNSKLFAMIPARLLYGIIVKDRYDVVVSFLEGPTTHIVAGCPYEETKKVAWIHTTSDNEKLLSVGFYSLKKAVKAYSKMNKVVGVSNNVIQAAKKYFAEKSPDCCVLYNVIESQNIFEKSKESIADDELSTSQIKVISVGKVQEVKGYDRLAKVHKQLLEEGLKHHIYILGIGEEQSKIEEYLKENDLQDSFTFLGFRENPYKYVAAADMYVCSSRREGFSTAVTESLIVGTPVVSTCCSGAYELLGNNNEYGIVVENSEEGIYEGMKKMLSDETLRKHYAEKALERGKEFSTDKTVKAVEDMLLSL